MAMWQICLSAPTTTTKPARVLSRKIRGYDPAAIREVIGG
jgi:hypothetical protein